MKRLALLGIVAAALAAAVPARGEGLTLTGETGVARSLRALRRGPEAPPGGHSLRLENPNGR